MKLRRGDIAVVAPKDGLDPVATEWKGRRVTVRQVWSVWYLGGARLAAVRDDNGDSALFCIENLEPVDRHNKHLGATNGE